MNFAGSTNKTEVHGYALSNTEGKTTFYSRKPSENDDLTNLGNSGLEKSFIGSEYDEIIVETVLGDNGLKNKININEDVVIKIDAEGHEVHVFDGLINTVQEVRPIFWVEIGGNEIFDQIYLKLKKHSYVAFGIRAIGPKNLILRAISGFPYQLDAIDSMNSRVYADVFFVPNRYI
jgi:FkbM family methyltransferase